MPNILKGLIAGFVATIVLSAVMLAKGASGFLPQLDVIRLLATMTGGTLAVGWLIHFLIGTVAWGGLYAQMNHAIPGGAQTVRGMVFSLGPWLLMMIVVMPLAGQGFFAMNLLIAAPIATLILHLIFGAALGATYGALTRPVHQAQ